eukprot:COSAG01_NODE_11448_length_1930_cov_1946.198252_3_plen_123_part_00
MPSIPLLEGRSRKIEEHAQQIDYQTRTESIRADPAQAGASAPPPRCRVVVAVVHAAAARAAAAARVVAARVVAARAAAARAAAARAAAARAAAARAAAARAAAARAVYHLQGTLGRLIWGLL